MGKNRDYPWVIKSYPWVKALISPMGCLCTNGYPLAFCNYPWLLLVTHRLLQLQKQPMGDQFQCSSTDAALAFSHFFASKYYYYYYYCYY